MIDAKQAGRARGQQAGGHKGRFARGAERTREQGGEAIYAGEEGAAADGGVHCHAERHAESRPDGAAAEKGAG